MGITVDERFHPDLTEAVRRLVEHFQPERIYLFGSRARGDHREDSDYDILVVVAESLEPHYRRAARALASIEDLDLSGEVLVFTVEQFEDQQSAAASLSSTVQREGTLRYAN